MDDVNSEAVGQQQHQEQGLRETHRKSEREKDLHWTGRPQTTGGNGALAFSPSCITSFHPVPPTEDLIFCKPSHWHSTFIYIKCTVSVVSSLAKALYITYSLTTGKDELARKNSSEWRNPAKFVKLTTFSMFSLVHRPYFPHMLSYWQFK